MEQEIWKDIAGYEGLYQVSSLGRVKSCERTLVQSNGHPQTLKEKIRKPWTDHDGYLVVNLSKNGIVNKFKVHRLVAAAFISNDSLFADTVNHKNEVKTDNRVENLEWMSNGDNVRYSEAGPGGNRWGSKSPLAKSVRCVELDKVFGCISEASRWLGLSKSAVSVSLCRGCTAGGYHWEYTDKN